MGFFGVNDTFSAFSLSQKMHKISQCLENKLRFNNRKFSLNGNQYYTTDLFQLLKIQIAMHNNVSLSNDKSLQFTNYNSINSLLLCILPNHFIAINFFSLYNNRYFHQIRIVKPRDVIQNLRSLGHNNKTKNFSSSTNSFQWNDFS